ncbi:helix-turn-helix domain-containing protein [Paenibacillus sp. LMG 31460]|uniref:Helix-turn-helix domain-containing protein n=1 Tax=Paenibacillus germinis TaxID=2654979 RepID=A0ABX1YY00_9BACL|nr:helix-turn-helix domain-containing protein [Paenibacillus germinis]NOU86008.1 helix-turn-helix domain-containing protein [Paenibacillus germinis]
MRRTAFMKLLIQLTAVVFVITLSTGALVYRYVNQTLKEEVYQANTELLGQTKNMIEIFLRETEQMAFSLAINKDVQRAIWLPWDQRDSFDFMQNVNVLFSDKIVSSSYVHSIYLYNVKNGKSISNGGVDTLAGSRFENEVRSFLENKSPISWLDTRTVGNITGEQENLISFMMSVPINEYPKSGVLLLNIKEDLLYDAVVNINNSKLGNVAVLNKAGQMLSYKDKSMLFSRFEPAEDHRMDESKSGYMIVDIGGVSTFVSYITSDFNGWRYVTLNSASEVFKKSSLVLKMTLTVSGICLAIGLLLVSIVSGRHYTPIRRMLMAIEGQFGKLPLPASHRDEFSYITDSFRYLAGQNEEFQERFRQNEMVLKNHFLLSLLIGQQKDQRDIVRQMQYYGLNVEPEHFVVLVLRHKGHSFRPAAPGPASEVVGESICEIRDASASEWDEESEREENLLSYGILTLCEEFVDRFGKGVVIARIQRFDTAIVLNIPEEIGSSDKEAANAMAKQVAVQIRDALDERYDLQTTLGIGSYYARASDISVSFSEAMEMLLLERVAGPGSVISYTDMMGGTFNRKSFLAYKSQSDKLIQELKAGSLESAKAVKNRLIAELQGEEELSFSYKNIVLTQIVHSLITVILEINGQIEDVYAPGVNIYNEFSKLNSLPDMSVWFDDVLEKTHLYIQSKRENKNADLVRKIVEFVLGHYAEPLTLQTIADHVYMNGNYVSKLLKEETGQSFHELMTDIRFRSACDMLRSSDRGINEIAELCGFGQKQNLIRTFKKQLGMTPTEYRNSSIIERLEQ